MRKNSKYKSDFCEKPYPIFQSAILLMNIKCQDYDFVHLLNHLYHLNIYRKSKNIDFQQQNTDIDDDLKSPLFTHEDGDARLLYLLVFFNTTEYNMLTAFKKYNAVLFIYGQDAFEKQQEIYSDIADLIDYGDPYDLKRQHKMELLYQIKSVTKQIKSLNLNLLGDTLSGAITNATAEETRKKIGVTSAQVKILDYMLYHISCCLSPKNTIE